MAAIATTMAARARFKMTGRALRRPLLPMFV